MGVFCVHLREDPVVQWTTTNAQCCWTCLCITQHGHTVPWRL